MNVIMLLAGVFSTTATLAAAEPWCAVPLEKWTEARTVDSCTEAMSTGTNGPVPVPAPPFGSWKENSGVVIATGVTNCWSTMLMPDDREGGVITVRLTVDKSSGAERQLPGGCVRWGFHWGENLPGWDAGVVFGYQDPLNFYRLQISAARGELALWDATGGFLQLIPCVFEPGKPHDLTVSWRGAHVTAVVDDKKVMDYWDRSLPYIHGQVGLAAWKSEVRFEKFIAAKARGRTEKMPAHVPGFRFEPSGNLLHGHPSFRIDAQVGVILFDGYEPISYFFAQAPGKGDAYTDNSLLQEAVKLKPGWRSAYYNFIGPNGLWGGWRWPLLVGNLPEAFKVTESGEKLAFTFQVETPGTGRTDYACSVTFDARRGMYRYEYRGTLKLTADTTVNEFELSDPLTYNNRSPGPDVVHRWNAAGHRWWLYQGTNGAWERMPLTDYPNDYSTDINNAKTRWGKNVDFLYPDPAACPLFETELKWPQIAPFSPGQCAWGYDYHHREMLGGAVLKAGDERSFVMTFTALPPAEAEPIFTQSRVMPCLQDEKRVLIPFIATGTTFAVTSTWQDPSATMVWIGGVQDATAGHGDPFSLRLDGPGKTAVKIYHYMIEQYAKRWWVRGWFKTRGVKQPGLKLRIAYPPPPPGDDFMLGDGTHEWTYFSFVTDVFGYRDVTDMTFELAGEGQAWIDDVAVSALRDDENPTTTGTRDVPE